MDGKVGWELPSIGNRTEREIVCGSGPLPSATCTVCKQLKSIEDFFSYNSHGRDYRRKSCKKCDGLRTWENEKKNGRYDKKRQKQNAKVRSERKDPDLVWKFIWEDSRRSDRKAGRENDLTKVFIREAIADGCAYCGETEIRMTLDRVDNAIGHIQSNVKASCIRCNLIRRDMPFEAWLIVASAVREARNLGLLDNWDNRVKR